MSGQTNLMAQLYDFFLEPFLMNCKKRVAHVLHQYKLAPAIDICCGTGTQVKFLQALGIPSFGLDLDKGMIHHASKKSKIQSFLVADACHLPLRDSSFGAAILSFALHEKPEEERKIVINEALRILRPEGIILILDFENPWDKPSRWGAFLRQAIERLAGKNHYRLSQEFLRKGGLSAFLKRVNLGESERHWGK